MKKSSKKAAPVRASIKSVPMKKMPVPPARSSSFQQPVMLALVLLVMIVALAGAIAYWPGLNGSSSGKTVQIGQGVRNGTQVAGITILPKEGTVKAEEEGGGEAGPSTNSGLSLTDLVRSRMFMGKAEEAGDKWTFAIDRFQKLAAQPLKFRVQSAEAKELSPESLVSVQGEKMHFFMVHDNMAEFLHLIPSYANGVWNVSALMPTPGTYHAYVVFQPFMGDVTVYRKDLVVREESGEDTVRANPVEGLTAYEADKRAELKLEKRDDGRGFVYRLFAGDQPAGIEPYFEAGGYMSLFRHNHAESFISVPVTSSPEEGVFEFVTGKLAQGRYTAFTEFKMGGKVYIFPLTFDIGT